MIRIDRGPEPVALVLARDEHLARARLRGGPPEELRGYHVARDVLTERQIYKCAYCELTLRQDGRRRLAHVDAQEAAQCCGS